VHDAVYAAANKVSVQDRFLLSLDRGHPGMQGIISFTTHGQNRPTGHL
jgi:hypothetical protein